MGDGTHRQIGAESRQAPPREPLGFTELDLLFSRAEAQIDLLGRCQPENGPLACARWLEAFERGERAGFVWRHARPPNLSELQRTLDGVQTRLLGGGAIGALYAERAAELRLEAELAECVGSARFFALARRRYAVGTGAEWAAARERAQRWATQGPEPEPGPRHLSHDRASPDSLLSCLQAELERRALPVRVQVVSSLGSRAATGAGVVFVRAGVWLGAREARRIAQHEVLGHVLPRVRARAAELGLCRAGSARSSDDEEGRALCIEQRLGLMDTDRQIELGRRHWAALAVAEGATATDCVRLLVEHGAPAAEAAATYARVARGGGLCRELVYLPAWLRVQSAWSSDPELLRWLAHGRLSLAAAITLRELGLAPPRAAADERA